MVLSCHTCHKRARANGTCKNAACPKFSASRTGEHWKLKRLQSALGDVANCFGDFVQGGCVASLRHRHDVRMGIACGMHVREHIASATLRLEVLCVLFLCYWKWPAACILKILMRHVEELRWADAQGRAALYERSWDEAMLILRPTEFSVVGNRREGAVELLPRARVRKLGGGESDCFSYHLVMNPAKRRTAEVDFRILMEDLRSGRLVDAIAKLAESFAASGATYSTCEVHLRSVQLWASATYSRTTFVRWLFKAEDVRVEPAAEDWALLTGMGSGAEKGVKAAGNITYEDAVAVCDLVSKDLLAGSDYGLDDLVCFLCLSQNTEAVGCKKLPQPAPPVTVASDLGSLARCAQVPRRCRVKTPQPALGAAVAAAGSGVASPAGPPARRRPRWDVGLDFIMVLLPRPDQVRFSRSSRIELSKCLCHVRRWGGQCWQAVRVLVTETLHKDVALTAALTASGVSVGSVCRAVGCGLDLCDRLSSKPLPADVPLLGLALVRCSLKFELNEDQVKALGENFRAGGCLHKPGVERVECLLAMRT